MPPIRPPTRVPQGPQGGASLPMPLLLVASTMYERQRPLRRLLLLLEETLPPRFPYTARDTGIG